MVSRPDCYSQTVYGNMTVDLTVALRVCLISADDYVKYLGITLDSKVHFGCHIYKSDKKLSRAIGIMLNLNPILPQRAMLKLFYSLFHSHFLSGQVA